MTGVYHHIGLVWTKLRLSKPLRISGPRFVMVSFLETAYKVLGAYGILSQLGKSIIAKFLTLDTVIDILIYFGKRDINTRIHKT